jgi:hypothetical protein
LSGRLPGSKKTGRGLMEAFANIQPQPDTISEVIHSIENFAGVSAILKRSHPGLGEIYQFGSDEFSFMVCVCLYDGATTAEKLNAIIANLIAPVRLQDPFLTRSKTLLIAPDTDNVEAFKYIVNFDKVYHCWPLAFVRLMHGLESLARELTLDAVRKRFISIFPPEDVAPFSATESLERVKKK